MKVTSAQFIQSTHDYRKCPKPDKPEYAFIGRSNVGKSSLINSLTARKDLAKTSQNPGKTQTINHFLVNNLWFLVDLPGYGYAKVSKTDREKWHKMIWDYLTERQNLMCVFVLIDARHDPQKIDIEFINQLGEKGIPLKLIFTKADKIGPVVAQQNAQKFKNALLETWEEAPESFITSAEKNTGRDEVLKDITQMNGLFKK
ncbi:MAG: ribosome biogenesis GTP-binding protein YihA/YsxC [Spirosomataceae bacterium]